MKPDIPACVWAEAGIIEFRLCPLHLRCDLCEIQKKIGSNISHQEPCGEELVQVIMRDKPEDHFFPACQYFPSHTWIRRTTNNSFYLGLDVFISGLICGAQKIMLVKAGSEIHESQCFAWVFFNNLVLSLMSPIKGTVTKRNNDFHPDMVFSNFNLPEIGFNWLLELEVQEKDLRKDKWLSRREYLELVDKDMSKVTEIIQKNTTEIITSPGFENKEYEFKNDNLISEPVLESIISIVCSYHKIR